MKRGRKLLSWIVGVLALLIVVAVIVIATFDWNRAKPFINDKVSQAIGRPFEIQGDLSVHWRREPGQGGLSAIVPWPEFVAQRIRVANPDWAQQQSFATLDALRFRLSPLALLAHRITVPTVQLVQPTIDLQRDKQGRATWDFTLPQSATPSTWTLDIGAIGFDRGRIALDDAASNVRLQVSIEPLQEAIPYDQIVAQQAERARDQAQKTAGNEAKKTLASGEGEEPTTRPTTPYTFAWQAKGSYQGSTLSGDGKTGGVLALQRNDQPFPVQADVHIGDSHVALVGTLTDPVHLAALDLRLWFSGTSMAKLYPITGLALPDTPPYATEGHLVAELHKNSSHFSYRNFRGRVGGSDLGGNLDFTTGAPRPKLTGKVHSQLLQFSDLGSLVGADSKAQKEQRGDATPQPSDKALPVEPFRTDRWKAMDADVGFTGGRIIRDASLPIDNVDTHIVLDAGRLKLDPLSFGMAGGNVAGSIHLDGSQVPMRGRMELKARHLQLKQLFPTFQAMNTSFGEINGDMAMSSRGNSVAELLATADGELKLLMNNGAISKTLLETAGLNIGNVVMGKLFGDKTVKINCAATDMVATNGVFQSKLFVFDTEDAIIDVEGNVNFATERLDLDVTPHTKGLRVFSLRSPLYVKGTLKNPDVGVHTTGLILRGGGALALGVFAAPAAALAPLVVPSRGNEENACKGVLEQMRSTKVTAPRQPKANGK
jgi:uncharacterized protein involved in outer membrane biogenesis